MRTITVAALLCLVLGWGTGASAEMVSVTLSVDDALLDIDETTTVHVFAQVTEGAAADNGIYAYALNLLADVTDIADILSVDQLGDPDEFFSDPGTILSDGLHDIYGGDGGFFTDQNRGIGSPFEFLALEVQGRAEGEVSFSASLADNAGAVGIPDGFLLQQPGAVDVDFGEGVTITVIPEPTMLVLSSVTFLLAATLRRRGPQKPKSARST